MALAELVNKIAYVKADDLYATVATVLKMLWNVRTHCVG